MGRYYHGAIGGKFWVGIQGSGDIGNLVTITPEISYEWKACLCCASIEDNDYCSDCYESKEEHEEAVLEADEENEASAQLRDVRAARIIWGGAPASAQRRVQSELKVMRVVFSAQISEFEVRSG